MKSIQDIISSTEYDFLRTNEHLKDKLMFLVFGGSHAYGTNTPASDVDIRGCAFNSKADLLGFGTFEQVVEETTDTTVYGLNKLIKLLIDCNPNTIEMLGSKPEHYAIFSPAAQELFDNKSLFLSKKAAYSFGGYATAQLRRLQNAVARDTLTQSEKENHILASIKRAMATFNDRYERFDEGAIRIYTDKSNREGFDTEIFMDANLQKYPLRDYKTLWSEMNEVVKVYGNLNHRNQKKDDLHLNKHAMHLIRLYLMCLDILEKSEIITYRENDLDLLMGIRNGKYQKEDGTFYMEFFDMVTDYENHVKYALENTNLPEQPDLKRIEEFVISINEKVVRGEY